MGSQEDTGPTGAGRLVFDCRHCAVGGPTVKGTFDLIVGRGERSNMILTITLIML